MAVNVGSAVGYLDLDITGFSDGLKSAQSEANRTANSISKSLGGSMKSLGEGMIKVGGFATAGITTPIVTAVTASVKQFAKLEQSIGGVETLFKKSAPEVIKNAETAYKRAGIDANKYMEQVTGFSATLLQGLGGDTEKAAKYADEAIVDMSDNANKMGTDIGLIQDAYQGFAKDNYTMLDNLKLGYGGTKSEMARLVNESGVLNGKFKATADNIDAIPFDVLIDAIHRTQVKLGITGTTAKEAQKTVSGSFEMMKSSVLNFLQQLGNPGADMDKFAKEMIQSIGVFVDNVKRVLGTIWDNLPISPLQKKLIVAAAAFGPVMIAGGKVISTVGCITDKIGKAVPLVNQFASGFMSAGTPLAEGASSMTAFGTAIGTAIGPILAIIAVVAILAAAFKHLWDTNEAFRDKITSIWDGIKSKFKSFVQGMVDRLNAFGLNFKDIVDVIKLVWDGFCNLLAPVFEGAFSQISVILGSVLKALTGIFDVFIGIFTGNWDQAWQGVKEIFGAVWDLIKGTFESWAMAFKGIADTVLGWFGTNWEEVWTNVSNFFKNIWKGIKTFFKNAVTTIQNVATTVFTAVSSFFTTIWNGIKTVFTTVVTAISTFLTNTWNKVYNTITSVFQAVSQFITTIWNTIKQTITSIVTTIWKTITTIWNNILLTITEIVLGISNIISNIFNAIKQFLKGNTEQAKEHIRQAWQTAYNLVTAIIRNMKNTISTVFNAIKSIIQTIMQAVQTILTTIWNAIKTVVTNVVNAIKNTISTVFTAIKSTIQTIMGAVKTTLTNIWNAIKTTVTTVVEVVKTKVSNAFTNMKSSVTNTINALKSSIESVFNGIKTAMSNAIGIAKSNVVNAMTNAKNEMVDVFNGIGDTFRNIGRNVIQGIINGIGDMVSSLYESIKSALSGLVDKAKNALGISSPSKVFAKQIGRWIPPGIVQGFEAVMPSAMKAIQKDLNKGIDNIDTDDISVGADVTVSGFADKLKSIYNEVALWFESIESRIGNSVDSMMQSLDMLIRAGQVIVNSDGTLGYIGYNGFTKSGGSEGYVDRTNPKDKDTGGNGDIFIFNSPKAIDEIEAARQMGKTKRDMAEGF